MRVLFLTRLHPSKKLGPLESRLHDRLTELSELGHEVLVMTKWTGEPIDFELPARIEVRSPFKAFRPWEWPRALPMVFAWRPDLLHIFDPGLSTLERTVSVELIAVQMLDTMSRASRGRSSFRGSLVSLLQEREETNASWMRSGAKMTEAGWLRPLGAEKIVKPWDRAIGRRMRILLAGQIGSERSLDNVLDALEFMRQDIRAQGSDYEITCVLDRTMLSARDRKRLAHAERMTGRTPGLETSHSHTVGSRLHLSDFDTSVKKPEHFDVAIVAGLKLGAARSWIERLAVPIILSEAHQPIAAELERSGMGSQLLGWPVTEIAPVEQALQQAMNRPMLEDVWKKIESGELAGGCDVAANHLSRIYSQIAGTISSS